LLVELVGCGELVEGAGGGEVLGGGDVEGVADVAAAGGEVDGERWVPRRVWTR
jgi:hypothetical protein